MTEIKTQQSLLSALRAASERGPTERETHKQRVSFIMSCIKNTSGVTRERIEKVLAKQEGRMAS